MIFCSGNTGYATFEPTPWIGLSVADIVSPGFQWCLGFSLSLTIHGLFTKHATKAALINKIVLRAFLLLVLGLSLEGGLGRGRDLNFLGPLQRLSIVYLVIGATSIAVPKLIGFHGATDCAGGTRPRVYTSSSHRNLNSRAVAERPRVAPAPAIMGPPPLMRIDRAKKPNPCSMRCHDFLPYLLEWLVIGLIVLLYLATVMFLPVPGCPHGYQGPGGTHGDFGAFSRGSCSGATWPEHCCTGGAVGYADWLLFGSHTGAAVVAGPGSMYGAGPLSRFSLLGTAPAVLVAYIGMQSGKTLLHFKPEGDGQVVARWLLWAGLCGGGAAALHLTHTMPIVPALNNLSFVLAAACVWQLLMCGAYLLMDVLQFKGGFAFLRYMGANSLATFVAFSFVPSLAVWQGGGDDLQPSHTRAVLWQCANVACFAALGWAWWLHRFFPRL